MSLPKHILKKFFKKRAKSNSEWNTIIDAKLNVVNLDTIPYGELCKKETVDISCTRFWKWLSLTNLPFCSLDFPHKKALEFFFSCELLQIQQSDHLLDAAGGNSDYLDTIRRTRDCHNLYLSDHIYTGVHIDKSGTVVAGGDISEIHLPNAILNKISCHHAFEHFQDYKDMAFIREIERLLAPGGSSCVIPLFLVDNYTECWNIDHDKCFDEQAQLIIDKSASIPGADADGHFARFYDLDAFKKRIIHTAKEANLSTTIVTCRLDGKDIPDMRMNFGSILNCPLRALVFNKIK